MLGAAFQPLVSLAVAVTLAFGAVFAGLLLGLSGQAAVMTGTILVVSGPIVVGPLGLDVLMWAGWMTHRHPLRVRPPSPGASKIGM